LMECAVWTQQDKCLLKWNMSTVSTDLNRT
jgi:hypothetical protein